MEGGDERIPGVVVAVMPVMMLIVLHINPEDFPVITDAVDDYCDLHHVVAIEGIWIARKPTSNAYGWKTGDTRS